MPDQKPWEKYQSSQPSDEPKPWEKFGPSIAPTGTAQPNPAGPQSPNNVTGAQVAGMGSNILNNAIAGGGLGSFFGPVGTSIGAGAGALASLFQKPSETPLLDAGAALGSLGADAIPGLPAGRLARMIKQTVGTVGGALAGSQGDNALGFTKDTDYGKVGIYGAGSTVAGILGSLASEASPAFEASERLRKVKDNLAEQGGDQIADNLFAPPSGPPINYPLNVSEATGRFKGLTDFFSTGSRTAQDLAAAQSQAAQSAFQKIVGAPVDHAVNIIGDAAKYRRDLRGTVADFARNYRQQNAQTVTTQVPSSVIGPDGKPIMNDVTKTIFPKKVDWKDFQQTYGLTDDEKDMFFRAIKTNAEQYVNGLVPLSGENQVKGLFKLNGLMKVLQGSGNTAGAANLGQAFAMREIAPLMDNPTNGAQLADRIDNAMNHFKIVFDPKQVEALQDLATVARNASPLQKAASQSQVAKSGVGTMNRILFGTAQLSAVAAMGAHGMGADQASLWMLGAGTGATVALGTSTLIGKVLAHPWFGKVLLAASKGDQKAMSAVVRQLTTDYYSTKDQPDMPTPASRLQGLFQK